jgi:Flp pilus assembly secretin CpaC
MIRALAFCAVIFAVGAASAQSVTPRIVADAATASEPTIASVEPTPVSACAKGECPATDVATAVEKPADNHTLLKQKLAELNCLQSEIESLRVATGTPQQILVKMKVVEVSRTKMQKLGIDFASIRGGKQPTSPQPNSLPNASTGEFAGFDTLDDSTALLGLIEHLQQNNIAKVLTEPNLTVTCGRLASLKIGGEVPLPTVPGSDKAVEFKQFGTEVDVLAIAQGDNRVRLELRARVSELDQRHKIEVGGVRVPGLQVTQIKTGLDLKLGQTGVMSGLVQSRVETIKNGNKTFDQVDHVELLFLVTPEVVAAKDLALRDPASDAGAYHTANSASEPNPAERSLRVSKPYTPR